MLKHVLVLGLLIAAIAGPVWSQDKSAATQPAGEEPRKLTFDNTEALGGWTITGDVTVDLTRGRQGMGGALKIGPGGKALLKLRWVTPVGIRRFDKSVLKTVSSKSTFTFRLHSATVLW